MMAAGHPKSGEGGYVAIEVITGILGGKAGSFALQHSGTMDAGGQNLDIQVVPGSGSGELEGIRGKFMIEIEDGRHSYTFDYTLPASD
jgi:Protein of unknown function (DUF3224)